MAEGKPYVPPKSELGLVPPEAKMEVGRVYGNGAGKYDFRDWEKDDDHISYTDMIGAAERHIARWQGGERHDRESGLHPLAHAIARLQMVMTLEMRGIGVDDRGL